MQYLYFYLFTVAVMLLARSVTLSIFIQQYKHLNRLIFRKSPISQIIYGGENDYFAYIIDSNSFMIKHNGEYYFIYKGLINIFMPFHWYWYWKYTKWFKNNVDISKLKSL